MSTKLDGKAGWNGGNTRYGQSRVLRLPNATAATFKKDKMLTEMGSKEKKGLGEG
jgi:hypothetical protein